MNIAELEQRREQLSDLRKSLAKLSRVPRVLSVEDNSHDQDHLKKKLQPFRVCLESCQSSDAAIELLKQHNFEVVLLDLRLDGGSGLDVLSFAESEKIKSFFIVLTGMDDFDPMIKEALHRGAHFAIQKPINEDHLRLIFGTIQ